MRQPKLLEGVGIYGEFYNYLYTFDTQPTP